VLLAADHPEDFDRYSPMVSRLLHLMIIDILTTGVALRWARELRPMLQEIKKNLRSTLRYAAGRAKRPAVRPRRRAGQFAQLGRRADAHLQRHAARQRVRLAAAARDGRGVESCSAAGVDLHLVRCRPRHRPLGTLRVPSSGRRLLICTVAGRRMASRSPGSALGCGGLVALGQAS
jgi:hypothetical protein